MRLGIVDISLYTLNYKTVFFLSSRTFFFCHPDESRDPEKPDWIQAFAGMTKETHG